MSEIRDADVEALAEVLSWASGEMTRYDENAHPDHNRWSWRGDGHDDLDHDHFRKMARTAMSEGWRR